MCKTCGKYANFLSLQCDKVSTVLIQIKHRYYKAMDKPRLIRTLFPDNPHYHPQDFLVILPLFEYIFYPVSTAPIIIKMR